MKSKLSEAEILEKLLRKDDTALAILYEAYADTLLRYVRIRFRIVDEQVLQSCVCDSLIAFAAHPDRYQPERSALKSYLIRDIKGNILNEVNKEKRLKSKTVALLSEHENNKEEAELSILENTSINFLKEQVEAYFKTVFNDPLDERLAWMIEIEKVRKTSVYIQLLEIQHLSVVQQKAEVKRHKDRIAAQLRRKGWAKFTKKLKQDATR